MLKMNTLVLGVLFSVFAIGVTADITYMHQVENITRCYFNHECNQDECCLNSLLGFREGSCRKLARRGEPCSSNLAHIGAYGDEYWKHCPCRRGLVCMVNEHGRPLKMATQYNNYNMCVGPRQMKRIKEKRQKEVEELEKTMAAEESTTIINSGPDY